MRNVLEVKQVNKDYGLKGFKTSVLKDINLNVEKGDFISIMGPSGAGKTTLLNLMSTLDKPTTGQIILDGSANVVSTVVMTLGVLIFGEITG